MLHLLLDSAVFIYIDLRYFCTKDNKVIISPYLNSQILK